MRARGNRAKTDYPLLQGEGVSSMVEGCPLRQAFGLPLPLTGAQFTSDWHEMSVEEEVESDGEYLP
ncbi:hypothetical protein BRX36_18170 [Sphingomonas sp. S-NIH.Pt1_0416]|jgi:hypothetical protein|nr:hypothetical protein BRX36_18170 [Sphingomonas sp. S-NIH.Pt1_0416]